MCFLATLLVAVVTGCGHETISVSGVVSVTPAQGATNVPVNAVISATFSQAMSASSINASTFMLAAPGGVAVTGTVAYSGLTATFTPRGGVLAYGTTYTATITRGASSPGGGELMGDYVWSFTTLTPGAPGVVSVTPLPGATNVAVNTVVSATFNMPMDPSSLNTSTFKLAAPGGALAKGTVALDSTHTMATFTPANGLVVGTTYTATITTGVMTAGKTPMSANYVWTFTTVASTVVPSVVSVTPPQGAVNVGVSADISATFSLAMNPATVNGSTFTVAAPGGVAVTGKIVLNPTHTMATFTPANGLMDGTTYTATITTGALSAANAPLAATYVWTFTTLPASVPAVLSVTPPQGATNVGLSAVISATFSLPMSAASLNGSTFTLTAPGDVPVKGSVGLDHTGMTATFTPTGGMLAYGTTYTATITTGAMSTGSTPIVANYVWTFTTLPASVPYVKSVTPLPGATNVAASAPITATFSLAMKTASLNGTTFTVAAPGGVPVKGSVSLAGMIATFAPTGGMLAYNTTYTATITTGAMSTGRTPIVADYVWTFTTIAPAPRVVSTVPVPNATGVPVVQVLRARFNEAVNCTTLVAAATKSATARPGSSLFAPAKNFSVTGPGSAPVDGVVSCSGNEATFTPNLDLAYNTVYIATISTGVKDPVGTPMAAPYHWTFSTVPAPPPPPTVISTVPANLASGVPVDQALTATFSEAMDPTTINSASFLLQVTGGASVNGVITYAANGSVATFVPNRRLLYSTNYTATITTGAFDLDDSQRVTAHTWTFTTAPTPIVIPPTVVSTVPATLPENTDVPLNQIVSAVFSTPMKPDTINSTTFTLTGPGTTPVAGLVAYGAIGNQLVFLPTANLLSGTTYTATIFTGVQDLAGVPLAKKYTWTFKTGTKIVVVSPTLTLTVPANLATGVALNATVSATFSEAMNSLTLNPATFQLTTGGLLANGGTLIPATITYDAVNFIATLTPTTTLTASTTYTVLVTDGATDLVGDPLVNTGKPNPWTFKTGTKIVPPPVILGPTILLFGGLGGGAGMTNTGDETVVYGDIGSTGASTTMTGFYDESVPAVAGVYPCSYTAGAGADYGLVTGTIETAPGPPSPACPDEGTGPATQPGTTFYIATQAAAEALTAYNTLQGLPGGHTLASNELGNTTLFPGIYKSSTFYDITAGPLTLDAQGDPNAYWVFQMGSYLTVGSPGTPSAASDSVILLHGALASHVFWAVGSATTINPAGGGTFVGTVISQAGIAVSTAGNVTIANIQGRLIALDASTTLVNTVINLP